MSRTPSAGDDPPAEAGQLLETATDRDLTDTAFIDEVEEQDDRYRVTYDPEHVTPSLAIITVVSKITNTSPLKLDPLYETIDGDAVDTLVTADRSSVSQLTFQYRGYDITVGSDAVIEVVAG